MNHSLKQKIRYLITCISVIAVSLPGLCQEETSLPEETPLWPETYVAWIMDITGIKE